MCRMFAWFFFFPNTPLNPSARLFLTEVLPPSDDADLAAGELTWSHRLLSAPLPILSPQIWSGAAQMGVRLRVRLKITTTWKVWQTAASRVGVCVCARVFPHRVCYLWGVVGVFYGRSRTEVGEVGGSGRGRGALQSRGRRGDVRSKSRDETETLWAWLDLTRYPCCLRWMGPALHYVLSATIAATFAAWLCHLLFLMKCVAAPRQVT